MDTVDSRLIEAEKQIGELAHSVNKLSRMMYEYIEESRGHMNTLVKVVSGQTPDKCVPLETHRMIIKGILVAFSIIVLVALGLAHYAPLIKI